MENQDKKPDNNQNQENEKPDLTVAEKLKLAEEEKAKLTKELEEAREGAKKPPEGEENETGDKDKENEELALRTAENEKLKKELAELRSSTKPPSNDMLSQDEQDIKEYAAFADKHRNLDWVPKKQENQKQT